MTKLMRFSLLCLIPVMLTGCSTSDNFFSFPGVYKVDIQQGNDISQKEVNDLKPGMSKQQVAYLLGKPLLNNMFNENRWDYIYSFQPGGKLRQQQTLSIYFVADKLARITGDIIPKNKADL